VDPWLILPATAILFREVFVSGLREYLGDTAGLLKVTNLAKWKTTAQMTAIAVLFLALGLDYTREAHSTRLDIDLLDTLGQIGTSDLTVIDLATYDGGLVWLVGLALIWIAALLTLVTGWDYFRKALPHLGANP
jgi:CDP-diacylglycerol--glycerol-3-phosphate 3-phosphatidyltransferase